VALESGPDGYCETAPRSFTHNEAPFRRADYDLSRLLSRDTERGRPKVPVEQLKEERRKRGPLNRVQLTIKGCVGRCDVPNVVVITRPSGTERIGSIGKAEPYRSLLEWTVRHRDAGKFCPGECGT
jgi:hypothetical protein